MPKVIKYQKNAVIYFKGERPDILYLIKDGQVILIPKGNTASMEKKNLTKGDIFGLYSAIGKYPRQEDAVSKSNVVLLAYDEVEFEELIAKDARLSLQLMKMLSQELRRVHKETKKILELDSNIELSEGLFSYATMYLKNEEWGKAKYVLTRFLSMYPKHEKAGKVTQLLNKISGY